MINFTSTLTSVWLLIVIFRLHPIISSQSFIPNCIEIDPSLEHTFSHKDSFGSELCILVKGYPLNQWKYGFSSLSLQIHSLNDNKYTYYTGECREVPKSIIRTFVSSLFNSFLLPNDSTNSSVHQLNPYQPTNKLKCVYLSFDHYSIDVNITQKLEYINVYYGIGLMTGYVMIKYAPYLARKKLFGYIFGVLVGFFFSSVILSYVVYSFFRKNTLLSLFAGGTFLISSGMGLSLLVKYLYFSVQNYPQAVAIYASFTSFVSLAVVYYYEPFENKKILNILQWLIQLVGIFILYYSSNLWKLSFLVILCVMAKVTSLYSKTVKSFNYSLSAFNSFYWWFYKKLLYMESLRTLTKNYVLSLFRNRFCRKPRPKKYLTMDEFNEQGVYYTKKALDNLRITILNHPKNIQLAKVVRRPLRYIEFASGGDHLTDEERSDHASWLQDSLMCDDNESLSHIFSRSTNASLAAEDSLSDNESLNSVADEIS